uniref:Serine/threonine-protein phosphatase 2A activator n=1 Tax=Heterosigma akashiwo TaxID=2829 RepID=A0A7S3Y2V7_HETAK
MESATGSVSADKLVPDGEIGAGNETLPSNLPPPPLQASASPPPQNGASTQEENNDNDSRASNSGTEPDLSTPKKGHVPARSSLSDVEFQIPGRAIYNIQDLQHFSKSRTYSELMMFIRICNEKVKGLKVSDIQEHSEIIGGLLGLLDTLEGWVGEHPPLQQPMRFGNKAFRAWHAQLVEESPALVRALLPAKVAGASLELSPYLCTSFGNETRIDYGTGHETNFVVFLCCLFKLKVLPRADLPAAVLRVFARYLRLCHRLQAAYVMEPAGSHGVWGLDDYHCLPFLWGAAQLVGHPSIEPSSIHDDSIIRENKDEYLYLSGIDFVKQLKKGAPFAESSPMLNDISAIPQWRKVNTGMFRLYEGEVLGKFPVIQHFLFGNILPASWVPAAVPGFELPFPPESPGSSMPGSPGSPFLAHPGLAPLFRGRSASSMSAHSGDEMPPLGPMAHAPWAPEPEPLLPSPGGSVRASRTNSFSLDDVHHQAHAFRTGV